MKYSEIVEPSEGGFVNNTNSWILVKGISYFPTVAPVLGQSVDDGVGVVLDKEGNILDQLAFLWSYAFSTGNTNQPYLPFSYGFQKEYVLVPPGCKIQNFGFAVAFYLDYDEVMEFLGIGSKK